MPRGRGFALARELGCGDREEAFVEKVRKLAKAGRSTGRR
jgi:hypothetical protein